MIFLLIIVILLCIASWQCLLGILYPFLAKNRFLPTYLSVIPRCFLVDNVDGIILKKKIKGKVYYQRIGNIHIDIALF